MKTKILLVDDDPNIRQLVNLYLKKEDYDVVLADRGDTALEKFKSDAPNLILLDLMLPGMDGWQVLREIRKTSNVPIIMLTAKDETFDKVLGLELGADDYVAKPFEPKELLARIKAVLRRFQPAAEPDSKELSYPGDVYKRQSSPCAMIVMSFRSRRNAARMCRALCTISLVRDRRCSSSRSPSSKRATS